MIEHVHENVEVQGGVAQSHTFTTQGIWKFVYQCFKFNIIQVDCKIFLLLVLTIINN